MECFHCKGKMINKSSLINDILKKYLLSEEKSDNNKGENDKNI